MQEFLNQFAAGLDGFPHIIVAIMGAPFGSLCSVVVALLATVVPGSTFQMSPGQIVGQFFIGWVFGAFGSPLVGWFLTLLKLPDHTINFLAGAIGFWFMSVYLKLVQKKYENIDPPKSPFGQ